MKLELQSSDLNILRARHRRHLLKAMLALVVGMGLIGVAWFAVHRQAGSEASTKISAPGSLVTAMVAEPETPEQRQTCNRSCNSSIKTNGSTRRPRRRHWIFCMIASTGTRKGLGSLPKMLSLGAHVSVSSRGECRIPDITLGIMANGVHPLTTSSTKNLNLMF